MHSMGAKARLCLLDLNNLRFIFLAWQPGQGAVRKLEHRSHFSLILSLWTPPLFLSFATFPLYVLPNRPHSPPSLVFIMASSLT